MPQIPSATRAVRVLEQLVALYGRPDQIRLDNGPELTSQVLTAVIERFNRTYREEVLNAYLFHSTQEAQALSDARLVDDNEQRPHDALGRVPPLTYLPRVTSLPESRNPWSA